MRAAVGREVRAPVAHRRGRHELERARRRELANPQALLRVFGDDVRDVLAIRRNDRVDDAADRRDALDGHSVGGRRGVGAGRHGCRQTADGRDEQNHDPRLRASANRGRPEPPSRRPPPFSAGSRTTPMRARRCADRRRDRASTDSARLDPSRGISPAATYSSPGAFATTWSMGGGSWCTMRWSVSIAESPLNARAPVASS